MRLVRKRRRGMSAIIVTFVLIVVTLITSVMVASFTFGLISSYIPPAEVTVQGATCSATGNTTTCQLILTNEGAKNTATSGTCSLDGTTAGSVVGGGTVPAGGSLDGVECVAHNSPITPGSNVKGELSLTNGAILPFIGSVV